MIKITENEISEFSGGQTAQVCLEDTILGMLTFLLMFFLTSCKNYLTNFSNKIAEQINPLEKVLADTSGDWKAFIERISIGMMFQ